MFCIRHIRVVFVNKGKGKKQTKGGVMDFQCENRKLTSVQPLLFCIWIRINRCMVARIEPVLWFPFQSFFGFVMNYGMAVNSILRMWESVCSLCVWICTFHFFFVYTLFNRSIHCENEDNVWQPSFMICSACICIHSGTEKSNILTYYTISFFSRARALTSAHTHTQ